MNPPVSSSSSRTARWLAWIILPLIAGILVSLLIPRPVVGVIYLDDAIYSTTAQQLILQIDYARKTPGIRAVVLVFNSPGGTVSDTESVYRELALLRETKPVVTVVEGMAASGAYYLSCGTDYIVAKASSDVGNIGVIGYMPDLPSVADDVFSTGPYKLWGAPRDYFVREIDMLKQGFLKAVQLGRGSALQAAPEQILTGQIWSGAEALKLGLIDELGTQSRGVEKAAELAKIRNYQQQDLRLVVDLPESQANTFFQMTNGVVTAYPQKAGVYLLYIPPEEMRP
jgi:protease-4